MELSGLCFSSFGMVVSSEDLLRLLMLYCWWLHIIENMSQESFFSCIFRSTFACISDGDGGWRRSTSGTGPAQQSAAAVVPGGLWDGVPQLLVPAASSAFTPFPPPWSELCTDVLQLEGNLGTALNLGSRTAWVGCMVGLAAVYCRSYRGR